MKIITGKFSPVISINKKIPKTNTHKMLVLGIFSFNQVLAVTLIQDDLSEGSFICTKYIINFISSQHQK